MACKRLMKLAVWGYATVERRYPCMRGFVHIKDRKRHTLAVGRNVSSLIEIPGRTASARPESRSIIQSSPGSKAREPCLLAPTSTSMPAASGCRMGNASHLLLPFLAICSSDHAGRMPGARTQSKLPIEIVAGNRQTSSHVYATPRPTLYGRASNRAPMSARAVAVIRPAPSIIARLAFLCILSGPRPVARF
jgi:hypothetical protein